MDEQYNNPIKHEEDRPTGFGILIMLSSISSVFWLLGNFIQWVVTSGNAGLSQEDVRARMFEYMQSFGLADDENTVTAIENLLQFGPVLSVIGMIVAIATLIAVILMFKGKRLGFHIYVAARIVEVMMPPLVAGVMFFSSLTLILSIAFIYFYSRYLRLLK